MSHENDPEDDNDGGAPERGTKPPEPQEVSQENVGGASVSRARRASPTAKQAASPAKGSQGDKRERILKAAIKVFARKGFYSTRVSEIAKAAGVADGTIYLYFKNKDDVLISIFQDQITKLIDTLSEEIAKRESFQEKVEAVIDIQLGLVEGHRDLAEVVTVNLRQSSRLLKQYGAPLFGKYIEIIAQVFEEAQRKGEVRPELVPRVLARALWGALDAITLGWALSSGDREVIRKAARQVSMTFLDGVRVRTNGDATS